jgi:hypothetical protein
MRSNRIDTKFWSLGEEWERNFAKLQDLPPRHCFIKHKIEGGMLPIETEDINPAWQALGMNPTEYPAYVESLPFGKKYLLERSALSLQPVQTQTPLPDAETQLDKQQQAFLDFIIANPDTPISSLYKGLEVSVRKGNEIRDSLKDQG